MELNWSTFVLEIINFLVLVWLLKRFLYKPVTEVIARRKAGIDKTLADAKALHDQATELETRYQSRLADWESERRSARETLAQEIETRRKQQLEQLQASLEQEREKARVAEQRRQADATCRMEQAAVAEGARFAQKLLEQVAGPETDAKLVDLALASLSDLGESRVAALRQGYRHASEPIGVRSAYPLDDDRRQRLRAALTEIVEAEQPTFEFTTDPDLVAGLHVTVGDWVLKANLRDELSGFAALAVGDGE